MEKPKGSRTEVAIKPENMSGMVSTWISLIPRPNEVIELGEVLVPLLTGINEVVVQPNGPEGPRWNFNFRNTTEVILRVFIDLESGTMMQQLEQHASTPTRAEDMRTFLKAIEEDKNASSEEEESSSKGESGLPSGNNEGEGGSTSVLPSKRKESSS
ncbi:hypothetical protein LCGC14_0938870 [marine sediment metagenome]|uniref:Uncharacterized protein n=1 Tax=marine sediment metagenome TaxID=412755 RepID=A0A0F9NQB2_9ZZZZ